MLSHTQNATMDKYDTRKEILKTLVDAAGGPAQFAKKYSRKEADKPIDETYVSQILNGHRKFGEKAARNMEKRAGLPENFFDQPPSHAEKVVVPTLSNIAEGFVRLEHLSARPSMGPGTQTDGNVQIVQHLDVLQDWLTEEIGSTDPKKIKVLTATGRSMLPTIADRDLVFVDITRRSIDSPGIYVIDVHHRLLLKKVMIQSNGTIIIRSDNTDEYPDEERYSVDEIQETIHICGKVMAWWTLKKG